MQAVECDPTSPEPQQALASLRYEQGRVDEALATLRASMAKWWKPPPDESDEEGAEDGDEEMQAEGPSSRQEDPAAPAPPSYEFRFECAKLLIELDESTETAVEVCAQCIAHLRCDVTSAPGKDDR